MRTQQAKVGWKSLAIFIVSLTLAVSLGELIADTKSSAVLRVGDAAPSFRSQR